MSGGLEKESNLGIDTQRGGGSALRLLKSLHHQPKRARPLPPSGSAPEPGTLSFVAEAFSDNIHCLKMRFLLPWIRFVLVD